MLARHKKNSGKNLGSGFINMSKGGFQNLIINFIFKKTDITVKANYQYVRGASIKCLASTVIIPTVLCVVVFNK